MRTELIIGYGSLMSLKGIDFRPSTKEISIHNAYIVRLHAKRGFNKDPLYMDIEWRGFDPSKCYRVDKNDEPLEGEGYIECLAIEIPLSHPGKKDFRGICSREGIGAIGTNLYDKRDEILNSRGKSCLAEYLWGIYEKSEGDTPRDKVIDYRKRLKNDPLIGAKLGHHYVLHPVKLDNGRYGIITIHPDMGIKGEDHKVVPPICDPELRSINSIPDLKKYFQLCILGGVHGIDVRDLIKCLKDKSNASLKQQLLSDLNISISKEEEKFMERVQFDYENRFGNHKKRLERSGLKAILESVSEAPEMAPQRSRIKIVNKERQVEARWFSIQDSKLEGYRERNPELSQRVNNKEFILLNTNVRSKLKIVRDSMVTVAGIKLEVHQCARELDHLEEKGECVAVVSERLGNS